ncbi:MAG: 2'-5' RNA ligase family protein [Anaerolineales bacterium]
MELESALIITPPRPVQAFAYPLREEYDPDSFAKVPAHFTIFYPFIPADQSDEAAEVLGPICAQHSTFDVTLERYGQFEDAIFLEPTDPEPLIALYKSLAGAYPEFAREDYYPHLTLGRAKDPSQIPVPDPPSFTFPVDSIRIYVGSPEDHVAPYIPRLTIPLG